MVSSAHGIVCAIYTAEIKKNNISSVQHVDALSSAIFNSNRHLKVLFVITCRTVCVGF